MKYYKYILILLMTMGLSVSAAQETINIKLSDIDENGNVTINLKLNIEQAPVVVEPEPEDPDPRPPTGTNEINYPALFDEDIAEFMPVSTVDNPHIPLGLQAQFDIEYAGAFRVSINAWTKSSNYAVGVLAYNKSKESIFIAGHDHHNAIAEFKIPDTLSLDSSAKNVVNAQLLQPYTKLLENTDNNKITGLLVYGDHLLVNSEIWYDGPANNKDNMQVLDINDITKPAKGMLQLEGKAMAAGYMSEIPDNMKETLGADYLTGWSSVYSITSRYSQGPSLYTFNPQDAIETSLSVPTKAIQSYPMVWGQMLVDGAHYTRSKDVSPIWGPIARGRYGFIVPNTSIFMVVGSHAGIHSGVFYKEDPELSTRECGGSCPYDESDSYSYFWLFDVNEMLSTPNKWDVQPFSYGKWQMPFKGQIIGAVFDGANRLFMAVSGAGQVGQHDRPPMILTYKITVKETN